MSLTLSKDADQIPGSVRPFTVISTDGHVGPSVREQLREYCESKYLADFDEYVRAAAETEAELARTAGELKGIHADLGIRTDPHMRTVVADRIVDLPTEERVEAQIRASTCPGLQDPHARLRDLDGDGVAGEVLYAGGQNGEGLPFMNTGFNVPSAEPLSRRMDVLSQWQRGNVNLPTGSPLSAVGLHIYNRWLADFVSVAPERQVGLMHVPVWDVEASVAELQWGREHGLRGINFPAPRGDLTPYNDPQWEPFWSAAEELDLPLCTHAGAGDIALGISGPGGSALLMMETGFLGRRGIWQLILGGVFERHPGLRLSVAEQGASWVPELLEDLDSMYYSQNSSELRRLLPELPSHYWHQNCFIALSFMAHYEAEQRERFGVDKIMWGSDYPHVEGTWPHTLTALRVTFRDIPVEDTRRMLGENAMSVFGFDKVALDNIAARIGPTPEDLSQPVGELPVHRGNAFRQWGKFA
jgi:predicted TIM-barrel fold metal-dependent hydrolase